MRKVMPLILVLVGMVFIVYGLVRTFGDPMKDEIMGYYNDRMGAVRTLEKEAVDAYRAGWQHYERPKRFLPILEEEIIPAYEILAGAVTEVKPQNPEIAGIHALLVQGVQEQLAAMNDLKEAIDVQDRRAVRAAESKLREATGKTRLYRQKISELALEHGISLL